MKPVPHPNRLRQLALLGQPSHALPRPFPTRKGPLLSLHPLSPPAHSPWYTRARPAPPRPALSPSSVYLTHVFKISRRMLANWSSSGGMLRARQCMTWFALRPLLSAMTPARSMLFTVRSRCTREADPERNSASAMAPAEVSCVEERKRRLRAVLSVNAVRNDWIWRGELVMLVGERQVQA